MAHVVAEKEALTEATTAKRKRDTGATCVCCVAWSLARISKRKIVGSRWKVIDTERFELEMSDGSV